jgi:hypothetical protein
VIFVSIDDNEGARLKIVCDEVFGADNFVEIERISSGLTSTLRTYVPAAEVQIKLDSTSLTLPVPHAIVRLSEDGFSTTVARCGHGLQRAFILTLLQQLAAARLQPTADDSAVGEADDAADDKERHEPALDLVILIEEPELFQHPSRQRHFAEVLKRLASESITGVARRVQVIYCTHSPHFVGLDRFEDIRLFRKGKGDEGRPKVSRVYSARFDQIAERIGVAFGEKGTQFAGPQFRARLGALIDPRTSEGFFANIVVLVEGESDRAAILGTARSLGLHFEARGIAVISCSGKSNVLNLAALYKALEITTYCVWDGDGDKPPTAGTCSQCGQRLDKQPDPGENARLLRLHGADPVDFPPLQVTDDFACFRTDLEKTIRSEIGEEAFDQALEEAKAEFGMARGSQAIKNPALIARVLGVLRADGHVSTSLESIVMRIAKLADFYDGGAGVAEPVPLKVPDLVPEVQGRGIEDGMAQGHVERA